MIKIIYLKETLEAKPIFVKANNSEVSLQESNNDSNKFVSKDSIMVDVESIHSVLTKNFTYYSPEALQKSVEKWTQPYEKPVIMHHNDEDGTIIGRVKKVKYVNKTPEAGVPGLIHTLNISDKKGIEGVESGRLLTVSIGSSATEVICSVCGTNVAECSCHHQRGEVYDGELCYWIINELSDPKEISYVIVPSDKYAKNIKVYKPNENGVLKESINKEVNIVPNPKEKEVKESAMKEIAAEIQEETNEEVKEQKEIIEEVKEDKVEEEVKEETSKNEKEDKNFINSLNSLHQDARKMEADIISLKKQLGIERSLKEQLEVELAQLKEEKKTSLIEKNNKLRKQLNLSELDHNVANATSIETLEASISNYEEIIGLNTTETVIKNIEPIKSEAFVSEAEDKISSLQEKNLIEKEQNISNKEKEVDFEKDLINYFKN